MARERDWEPDDELDDEQDEWQTEEDEDEDEEEGSELEPCPYCGKDIYEGAEMCPHCKSYISEEDAPAPRESAGRFPRWLVIVIVAAVVAAFSGLFGLVLWRLSATPAG